jgi:amino acid permease
MSEVSHWIILVIAAPVLFIIFFLAARLFLRMAFILAIVALTIFSLHYFSLLPDPVEKAIDKFVNLPIIHSVSEVFAPEEPASLH